MRNRIVPITAIVFIFIFGSCAMAEEPQNAFRRVEINWNIRSYNRLSSSRFIGDQLSIAVKVVPRIAAVAEVDEHTSDCGCKITAQRYGARFSSQLGKRWTHYEQVLAGTAQYDFQNGSSMMAGGGIDFAIRPWLALRPAEIHYTYYQFDSLTTSHGRRVADSFSTQGFRIDGGIVIRFLRK